MSNNEKKKESKIEGVHVNKSNGQTCKFLMSAEFWEWVDREFSQYIGKKVEIVIREI